MLYTKKIEDISYQDVVDFCNQRYRETIYLDYKRELSSGIAKTIAAMANTWGGLIVVGVDDEDSKPKLPVNGIKYKEHIREQVNNIILSNITPPVFPEIQVCDPQEDKTFVVIRVPQSDTSPHALKSNTKVYLRTDTSNEPEELASVDRILWLVNRRQKSVDMRDNFYKKSIARYSLCCDNAGTHIQHSEATLTACPLYPFEILVTAQKLKVEILDKIKAEGRQNNYIHNKFPSETYHDNFTSVHQGIYNYPRIGNTGYISYIELNEYGLLFCKEDFGHTGSKKENGIQVCYLLSILIKLDLFLESIYKLYSEIGYWGIININFKLDHISGVTFRNIPAPPGKYYVLETKPQPIDESLSISKNIPFTKLKDERVQILIDLFLETAWALGFSKINRERVEELLRNNGRL